MHWYQILVATVGPLGREWGLQHLLATRGGLAMTPTVVALLQGLQGTRVSCGVLSVRSHRGLDRNLTAAKELCQRH